MTIKTSHRLLACLGVIVLASVVAAQDTGTPADDDQMTNESVESRIDELGRRAPEPISVAPAHARGMSIDDLRPPAARLVREGAFLTERRGRIAQLSSGHWVYLFDADASGEAEPPMILSPGLRLTEMIRVTEARPDTVTFLTSGEVFVYRNRNYFMPLSFATLPNPVERSAAEATRRDDADRDAIDALVKGFATEEDRAGEASDPSVGSLLSPFNTERRERQVNANVPGARTDQPANLRREGAMLVLQRGHLRRNREGLWSFVIDNDADVAPGRSDLPLTLQPCLLLEEMEELVRIHGEHIALRVSGRVYVYQGDNYLLPTMFLVDYDPSGNLTPRQ